MHRILISVTAALGSALGYGASSVLQQRESEEQPDTEALKPVLLGALIAYAVRPDAVHRAASLGAAAGIANGIVAALTKSSAHLLRHGLVPLLTHWQPYALVAAGAASLTLAQSAFQAGSLAASLPMLTVVDPVASTLIGALLFGESLTITGA